MTIIKKMNYSICLLTISIAFVACNNNTNSKDSVELAEEANEVMATGDSTMGMNAIYDNEEFAIKAADGGITEVQMGKIAITNSTDQDVKDFGQMMIDDHGKANIELTSIAENKGIILPSTPGADNLDHLKDLNGKMGNDFDKSYIDMMVKDHQKTIDLFEEASLKSTDSTFRNFAINTLPVLRNHLAKANTIQQKLKEQNN